MRPLRSFLGMGSLLAACAHGSPPATAVTSSAAASASAHAPDASGELPPRGAAHALVVQATSCWLGGFWSDALGEKDDARDAGIQRRCDPLLGAIGASREEAYYPLRALDSATVERLAQQVGKVARDDARDRAHTAELVSLFGAVADASRETVDARRAADKVKQVFASLMADERQASKVAAGPALRSSSALRALLEHGGPYAEEARVIGTLHALDRMEMARGLPKHLKVYAVEGAYLELFGVSPPALPSDAAAPIPTGTWLTYLTSVASAAGHPVPAAAKDPQNREPLAWSGVLEGFADKLRDARVGGTLATVARNVVARLDEQAAGERAAFEAHAPADR